MSRKQHRAQFKDDMYCGCFEMCVNKIKNPPLVRVVFDSLDCKEVVKSLAFIALENGNINSSTWHLESEESCKNIWY